MGKLEVGDGWIEGITQLEITDPVLGGPNGPANIQAKELGACIKYLKKITDEVIAARGGKTNLDARLDQYDTFDPSSIAALYGFVAAALDLSGLANRETIKTIKQRIQTGVVTITNRGVITGCTVTKSSTSIRNLSLSAGSFFADGLTIPCPAMDNSALVASNPGSVAQVCYGYVYVDTKATRKNNLTYIKYHAK